MEKKNGLINEETKVKVKVACKKVARAAGTVLGWLGVGLFLATPSIAIVNAMDIAQERKERRSGEKKVAKWAEGHVANENNNVDKINAFMDKTNERISDLERRNAMLMEKAISRTEGKEEERG